MNDFENFKECLVYNVYKFIFLISMFFAVCSIIFSEIGMLVTALCFLFISIIFENRIMIIKLRKEVQELKEKNHE